MAINFANVKKFEISVSSGKQYRELSYLYFNGTDNIISTPDTLGSSVYRYREITLSDVGELSQVSGIFFFATAGLYQYAHAGMYIGGGDTNPYLKAKACFDYEGTHYLDNPSYLSVMSESEFSNISSAKNRYVLYVVDNEDTNTNTLYPYTATSCVYDSSGTLLTSVSDNIVENTISSPSAGAFKLMATTDAYGSTVNALNAKLYSYIVKSSVDGSITINMVPAQRKSDSAYGMYDKIGGTFYPISGTTTSSTPGAIVNENPSWSPDSTTTTVEVKRITDSQSRVLWEAGPRLTSITLSGYNTSLNKDSTFIYGGTVTAHYSDNTTADVTLSTTFTGYDMSTAGEQTVTASYTENGITKTATYTLNVVSSGWHTIWEGSKTIRNNAGSISGKSSNFASTASGTGYRPKLRLTFTSMTDSARYYNNNGTSTTKPSSPLTINQVVDVDNAKILGVYKFYSSSYNSYGVATYLTAARDSTNNNLKFSLGSNTYPDGSYNYDVKFTLTKIEQYY